MQRRPLVSLGSAPARYRARPVQGDPAADAAAHRARAAGQGQRRGRRRSAADPSAPMLSLEARAEAGQRVAWIYYSLGYDTDARRVADTWRVGRERRMGAPGGVDFRPRLVAAQRLRSRVARVPRGRRDRDRSASSTPAAIIGPRASEQACRRPRVGRAAAARRGARRPKASTACSPAKRWAWTRACRPIRTATPRSVEALPNVRRAVELVKIGERALGRGNAPPPGADRPSVRASRPDRVRQAARPAGAQFWLANNGQPGALADAADRYPDAALGPVTGWRVDPALAFAPHHPGIDLPRRRRQPGRRGRPDAGPAGHRRGHGASTRPRLIRAAR